MNCQITGSKHIQKFAIFYNKSLTMVIHNKNVDELQTYFKTHNKIKEQKAHTSKVFNAFFLFP